MPGGGPAHRNRDRPGVTAAADVPDQIYLNNAATPRPLRPNPRASRRSDHAKKRAQSRAPLGLVVRPTARSGRLTAKRTSAAAPASPASRRATRSPAPRTTTRARPSSAATGREGGTGPVLAAMEDEVVRLDQRRTAQAADAARSGSTPAGPVRRGCTRRRWPQGKHSPTIPPTEPHPWDADGDGPATATAARRTSAAATARRRGGARLDGQPRPPCEHPQLQLTAIGVGVVDGPERAMVDPGLRIFVTCSVRVHS